jgi:hypothetical protein
VHSVGDWAVPGKRRGEQIATIRMAVGKVSASIVDNVAVLHKAVDERDARAGKHRAKLLE